MRRLQLRLARAIVGCNARRQYFTATAARKGYRERERRILGGFVERAAVLGFRRNAGFATGFSPLKPKSLDSIMDVERVLGRSPEEIASCWDDVIDSKHSGVDSTDSEMLTDSTSFSFCQYHLGRGHIGVTMKAKLYHLLEQRAVDCRYFVIPMWKGNGYTTMFVQVQMPHILFTGLEDYKAKGTQASPYFTVSFYKEFAETKDLVLVRGDIVFPSKLSDDEAKCLLETAQSFYLNDTRYALVERFNKQTHDFEFNDVLKALEMPSA